MTTAAKAPVTRNVATVAPRILPARLRDRMEAMEEAIEPKTNGTTMQNIILMKTWPSGWIKVAKPGATAPATEPSTMAAIRISRNR